MHQVSEASSTKSDHLQMVQIERENIVMAKISNMG